MATEARDPGAAIEAMRQKLRVLDDDSLDLLFREARTHNGWTDRSVEDATLVQLFDLLKMAPTSANCLPARFVFVKSQEAKERLGPLMASGNLEKTISAPVCVIIGTDEDFWQKLPQFFPHKYEGMMNMFRDNPAMAREAAFRNATLQGAYLILAARALGLDCGPMSGFDNAGVDAEFFAGTSIKSNFICNLGYGDPSLVFQRSPRPEFDVLCSIL